MRMFLITIALLLGTLPGCTSLVLKGISSEKNALREFTSERSDTQDGQYVGMADIEGVLYHDYRVANCLLESGTTRTLRVLVPVDTETNHMALITETEDPVAQGTKTKFRIIAAAEDKATNQSEASRTSISGDGTLTSSLPVFVLRLHPNGDATLSHHESRPPPLISHNDQMPAKMNLKWQERSVGNSILLYLLLPPAAIGDATVILLIGGMHGGGGGLR